MKGLDALERIGAEKLARGELIRNDSKVEPYYETIEKELKAFDVIKENFDIEVIVIDDYCYIEITSKICVMSKTQRAIKINSENKNKVEALKGFGKYLKYSKQKMKH